MSPRKQDRDTVIASNRAAYHNYFILETVEAGMALRGTEVKSLRDGGANLREGFIRISDGEAFLVNVHISPYEQGTVFNHEAMTPFPATGGSADLSGDHAREQ